MRHLDTDIIVAYLRGSSAVAEHIKSCVPEVAISTVVLAELLYGARVSMRPDENVKDVLQLAALVHPVVFDESCADAYSHVRENLRRLGRPIGETDTLIAATAVAHNAVLVTHNTKHFEAVQELSVEDWLADS